jgi:aryl-alcohol dehydrogenase-like predicted oxidoreductase
VHYSLLRRQIETDGILETARELGVTIIAYTPLAAGVLSGKYHQDASLLQRQPRWRQLRFQRLVSISQALVQALIEIAPRYQATPAQVALNWVVTAQGDMVVTIPGATRVRQAEEAAGAMRFRLSEDDLARLDELSRQFRSGRSTIF